MQKQTHALPAKIQAFILSLVIFTPGILLAQTSSPQLPAPGKVSMSRDQQKELGLQGMGEVYKQMPVLPDSDPLTKYVQGLGKKLQDVIPPDASWPYQFHVIPASDINAFAMPGGPIFVNVATIQSADNEAELAGVLAHEITHVYMQHSAKQAPKAAMTQIFAGIAGVLLPESTLGSLGRVGIQVAGGSVLAKYSRADESQADSVGTIIMYKAGYNPQAMADFFVKLEQKYGKGGMQWLSDHPNPGNRQTAIKQQIRNWPSKKYVGASSAFDRAHRQAEGTKTYTAQEIANGAKAGSWTQLNKQSGAWPAGIPSSSNQAAPAQPTPQPPAAPAQPVSQPGSAPAAVSYEQIKPSGRFSQVSLTSFTIPYPDNWKAAGQGDNATIGPQEGVSQAGVAYGVVIGTATGGSGSLDQLTQSLIQSLQRDNQGMRIIGDTGKVQVGGADARSTHLSSSSPILKDGQPVAEHDWLVTFLDRSGALHYVVFVATEQDFSKLKPTYEKMLEGVQLR
jgi:Zn-dependent protease with chaperone function